MEKKITYLLAFLLCPVLAIVSCKKEYLEKKPATNINVPTTIPDLQLLLDNTSAVNTSAGLGEISSDDFEIGYNQWLSLAVVHQKNSYIWAKDIYEGQGNIADWNSPYSGILTTNVVLEQVEKIAKNNGNRNDLDNIRGSALFKRAFLLFDLAQIFSLPYDQTSATTDLGIPIRVTADINEPTTRASIAATYNQILSDALLAKSLLSVNYNSSNFSRPSKASAYGFLARVYLIMRDYEKAGLYADSALRIHNTLIDYNNVNKTTTTPFPLLSNPEILYDSFTVGATMITNLFRGTANFSIRRFIYDSYDNNDLRKVLFFNITSTGIGLKNGYAGQRAIPNSITTDDLYLTRAECYARNGESQKAMDDLNILLVKRWVTGSFTPIANLSGVNLINRILLERRKELIIRGLRWNDIRRLNKEGANIILTRTLNGTIYTLNPNDSRYALPIPPDVIARSGIQQNNR